MKSSLQATGAPARAGPGPPLAALWLYALLLGMLYLLVVCAWQADDAFISFRTARNAWEGQGLGWNPGQRVQAYTHPLWMGIAWAAFGLFGEFYFSMLVVCIGLALATAAALVRAAGPRPGLGAIVLLTAACSSAFVDYAVSGLENPLLYLLLVLFVALGRRPASARRLLGLSLLAAGVGLTRLDALLLVGPALLLSVGQYPQRPRALGLAAAGLLPLLLWEAFALVYYGSLVPNTALAKLNVELPVAVLVRQGLAYLADSLAHDPITLLATGLCVGLAALRGSALERLLGAGVCLYLLYVLRIGGDFMAGRFLAAPLAMALALGAGIGARARLAPGLLGVTALLLCAYGLLWPESRWTSGPDFGAGLGYDAVRASGIADERAYYYPTTGLVPVLKLRRQIAAQGLPTPPYRGAIRGARFAGVPARVVFEGEVGYFGYFAGPGKIVVDAWALGDPLLARIPYRPGPDWRIGHYERRLPAGYLASLASGENRLVDPGLARVYDALGRVVRGPLFTRERWREIWRLHTGYYRGDLERADYR